MSDTGTEHQPSRRGFAGVIQRRPIVAFCVLLAALSWPVQIVAPGSLIMSLVGPSLCGFAVVAVAAGRRGAAELWGRVLRWRAGGLYYGFAVLGLGAYLLGVTYLVTTLLFPAQVAVPTTGLVIGWLINLVIQFVAVGLAEEFGWRGFLLPRLQRRHGPVIASLVVGLLWWVWHLPLRIVSGDSPARLFWFAVGIVAASFVYTWLFNSTGGSVLLVALMHAAENSWTGIPYTTLFRVSPSNFDVVSAVSQVAYVVLAVMVVVLTRGTLGQSSNRADSTLPADARRAHQRRPRAHDRDCRSKPRMGRRGSGRRSL